MGTFGPFDDEDLDPELAGAVERVDFGSVRVPVFPRGSVSIKPAAGGRMQAVHVTLPEGRLSLSALAAPRSSRLWPDLVTEIDASLRAGGARVRSFQGEWGRELRASTDAAVSVFVGVDGARWMVYGVATGPATHAEALDAELRRMLKGTVVVRGRSAYPVRTILPLTVPAHLADIPAEEERAAASIPAARIGPVPAREPSAPEPAARQEQQPPRQRTRRPAAPVPAGAPARPGRRHALERVAEGVDPDAWTLPLPTVRAQATGGDPAVRDATARGTGARRATEPALAFLMGDPLELFTAAGVPGRHRLPD